MLQVIINNRSIKSLFYVIIISILFSILSIFILDVAYAAVPAPAPVPGLPQQTATTNVVTLQSVFQNIDQSVKQIKTFLKGLFIVVGVGMTLHAVMKIKKFAQKTAFMHVESGVLGPSMEFFIGVILVYAQRFFDVVEVTLWRSVEANSIWNPAKTTQGNEILNIIQPMAGVIQIIGMIAFLRGWLVISKATSGAQGQGGGLAKGVFHVIGGILAININTTTSVVMATLGL